MDNVNVLKSALNFLVILCTEPLDIKMILDLLFKMYITRCYGPSFFIPHNVFKEH